MGIILLVVLVLLLFGSFPRWKHSRDWGYGPTSGIGLLILVILVLVIANVIPRGF